MYQLSQPTFQDTLPTTQEVAAALANCNGLILVAAEKLHITADQILIILASDPQALETISNFFRVRVLLTSYQNLTLMMSTVIDQMANADYADDIKAMQVLGKLFTDLSTAPTTNNSNQMNINVFDKAFQSVPKHVRDALTELAADAADYNVSLPQPQPQPQPQASRRRLSVSDDDDE